MHFTFKSFNCQEYLFCTKNGVLPISLRSPFPIPIENFSSPYFPLHPLCYPNEENIIPSFFSHFPFCCKMKKISSLFLPPIPSIQTYHHSLDTSLIPVQIWQPKNQQVIWNKNFTFNKDIHRSDLYLVGATKPKVILLHNQGEEINDHWTPDFYGTWYSN